MVRKKRGSSLVIVVIISGILITVGAAMLSMTLGDYKMRMTESTRIKDLYSSESGLDRAYDILIKTFDAGAIYGVNQVDDYKKTDAFIVYVAKEYKEDVKTQKEQIKAIIADKTATDKSTQIRECNEKIDEDNKNIKIEEDKAIDEYFKGKFNEFVYTSQPEVDKDIPNNIDELRKSIKGQKYVNIDSARNEKYEKVDIKPDNKDNIVSTDIFVGGETANDNDGIIPHTISADKDKGKEYPTTNYTIKITSKYITQDTVAKNAKTQTTERTLQSVYDMTVPDYKDVVLDNAKLTKYTFVNDKAIIVGGNMNVINSPLTVTGNIFVQGDGYEDTDVDGLDRAYNKYNGGIILGADSSEKEIEFNGDVITGKTFNIRSNINGTINGNLYAMNVYAGSEKATDDLSKNSTLSIDKIKDDSGKDIGGEVVVDNDITLKADDTHIIIDKFYGINDKNIKYDETKGFNGSDKPLGRTSSSIIVNAPKGSDSGIKINTLAYIMGVAHINTNTKDGYSTGESTGIKGNYIAYAVPSLDEHGNVDANEEFDYYDPLQLLKQDNVTIKSEHFVKYWTPILGTIDTGGIELPEEINNDPETGTYSIGAIVYKDSHNNIQIKGSSYNLDNIPTAIGIKQKEFASKVYKIGDDESLSEPDKQSLYESLGDKKDNVSDLMDIEGTIEDYKNSNKIFFDKDTEETPDEESNNEKAIFSNKNITIKGSDKDSIDRDGNDGIIINVAKDSILNAFIATSGNVTIEGKVNFQGNIIAKGDLDINTSEDKTIEYNKALLDRIQASNSELFNSVFGHMNEGSSEQENGITVQYDVNKFIKNKLWKIIK